MNEKDKNRIEEEVSKTLGSLDNLEDIAANPFFYTRLQAKLVESNEKSTSWVETLLFNNKLVPSLLTVFLILNIFTAFVMLGDNNNLETSSYTDNVEAIAEEYLLTEALITSNIDSE